MENKNALIGRLKIMKAYAQNEMQNQNHLQELAAALDMMSYKLCRKEAEVLRDKVEFLE